MNRPQISSSTSAIRKTEESDADQIPKKFTLFPEDSTDEKFRQHLMSSCSASNLPRFNGNGMENGKNGVEDQIHIQVKPRLSKSEENLIDLETPDGLGGGGLGFTLENPLYDLITNNSVFNDETKTDDQLLTEYGLNDYFAKLNIQQHFDSMSTNNSYSNRNSRRASGFSNVSQNSSNNTNPNSSSADSSKWATFD